METPRWHFRLDNFRSALALLGEAVLGLAQGRLSELEREGMIQRFEYTWELGWKAMRDFMTETGMEVAVEVPANIIRAAFQTGLITDGEGWIRARKDRNAMSHEYDRAKFEKIVVRIKDHYYPLLTDLEVKLEAQRASGN